MRWDPSPAGGFTTGEPWLPTSPVGSPDVTSQLDDPTSMLWLHRRLLELRRRETALSVGGWRALDGPSGTLGYARATAKGQRFVIALGLDGAGHRVALPGIRGAIAVDTGLCRQGEGVDGSVELGPDAGVVIRVDPD